MSAPRDEQSLASPDGAAPEATLLRRVAATASWDALPDDALARIMSHLAGDVCSLCAAACVARSWRDAAAEPTLWVRLSQLPRTAASRLTDAHLMVLVALSRGGLESLDLRGAELITDDGLTAALQQPHALVSFSADHGCKQLSAQGVLAALASRRGRLRALCVRGMQQCITGWHLPRPYTAAVLLRGLLEPRGVFDVIAYCGQDEDAGGRCGALCGPDDVCGGCQRAKCLKRHRP